MTMMKSKPWKIARTALILVALLGLSLVLWVYFIRQDLAVVEAARAAKAQEEWDKRYPVKGRRTDLGESHEPSLPETGAPPLDTTKVPGVEAQRPRMRISRGKDE